MSQNQQNTSRAVLLLAVQQPEYDLNRINQVLGSRGFTIQPPPEGAEQRPAWTFRNLEGDTEAHLQLILELGLFRLAIHGSQASFLERLLPQAFPTISPDLLEQRRQDASNPLEQRVFVTMLILSCVDAQEAMSRYGDAFIEEGPDELREGVLQGLALLESPDALPYLRRFVTQFQGSPLGELAARALAALARVGLAEADPDALLDEAEDLLPEAPEEALALLDEADALGAKNPRRHLLRGRALRLSGELEGAITALERATSHRDLVAPSAYERALACEALGRTEDAQRLALEAAQADHPEAPALLARLNLATDTDTDIEARLARLDAAIEEHPDDLAIRERRGRLLLEDGRYARAAKDLKAVLKAQPENAGVAFDLAQAQLGAQAFLSALKTASDLDPEAVPELTRPARALRGRVYLALEELERARDAFAKSARIHPEFPELRFGQGVALERLGQTPEAIRLYQQALQDALDYELVGRVQPIVYEPLPAWNDLASEATVEATPRPEKRRGTDREDPFFKTCIECGHVALARRTSCKNCNSSHFFDD